MTYLIILLIALGSIHAPNLHAGAGTAAWLRKQAECGGRCPNAIIHFFKSDAEPEEKHDPAPDEEYDSDDDAYYDDEYEEEPYYDYDE